MKITDLDFSYPENLIATEPQRPSRVLWVENNQFSELAWSDFLKKIPAGDVLVLNNSKVLKRRVFINDLEILFLSHEGRVWDVLFPSKKIALGSVIDLPLGKSMKLVQKGRPQKVELNFDADESYFEQVAELPLPPYIQKAREQRHNVQADESWYQTAWAKKTGSLAAPTASLHFSVQDIEFLKQRGVQILELTLHVGLGTFLPVTSEDLNDHDMHEEYVEISSETLSALKKAKAEGRKVWALGTTAARALESEALGLLPNGKGLTKLLIQEGFQFQRVDRLLTNFHQPQSTLLALVAGFAGLSIVKEAYRFAVDKQFRLFSYGDLSVWITQRTNK